MRIRRIYLLFNFTFIGLLVLSGCATTTQRETIGHAENLTKVDQYTITGEKHFLRDYSPFDAKGNINVVVEIPAGTNAKWEVDKTTGQLKWEFKEGKPRVVSYLGYPGNYGMVPGTLLLKELGGDGDPLDVIVIGPAVPRGSVIQARPIGVLKMLDDGEQDDKIIALLLESPLDKISTIKELEREYQGITNIIEIWFSNYKGPGEVQSKGFGDVAESRNVIEAAAKAYKKEFSTSHQGKE
jgi:inorganic pyrophosphatase